MASFSSHKQIYHMILLLGLMSAGLLAAAFAELGIMLVLIGAFTPLPYKIIAISAGLFGYGLLPFLLLSAVGRTARFLLVGGVIAYRRDMRMVTGFASLLLLLVCAGIYMTR